MIAPLTRKPNWPVLLALFIEEKREQPFVWGVNDCCLFSCDWLTILTGVDPAGFYQLRGHYTTALSAVRFLKSVGGVESIAERWALAQGWERVPLSYAQRGSLTTFQTKHGAALGVVNGEMSVFAGVNGLSFVKTSRCSLAWHIP